MNYAAFSTSWIFIKSLTVACRSVLEYVESFPTLLLHNFRFSINITFIANWYKMNPDLYCAHFLTSRCNTTFPMWMPKSVRVHWGLTWCLDDLDEPHDRDQPDCTAAEPLEGPPVPRCCSHSSRGHIFHQKHLLLARWHLFRTFSRPPCKQTAPAAGSKRQACAKLCLKTKTKNNISRNPPKITSPVPPPTTSSRRPAALLPPTRPSGLGAGDAVPAHLLRPPSRA